MKTVSMKMVGDNTGAAHKIYEDQWLRLYNADGKNHYEREVWASFKRCPTCDASISNLDPLGKKGHIVPCTNQRQRNANA